MPFPEKLFYTGVALFVLFLIGFGHMTLIATNWWYHASIMSQGLLIITTVVAFTAAYRALLTLWRQ